MSICKQVHYKVNSLFDGQSMEIAHKSTELSINNSSTVLASRLEICCNLSRSRYEVS